MNKPIPEFTDTEISTIEPTLAERYREPAGIQLADSKIRLESCERELTGWQFFYRVRHEHGTGIREFHDLLGCPLSLLRVQADHEHKQKTGSEAVAGQNGL